MNILYQQDNIVQTPKMRRVAVVLIGLTLLTGCDFVYGVTSDGTLPANLNIACVTNALADDPAFATAKPIESENARQNGRVAAGPLDYAWFYGENNLAILQLTQTSGTWRFSNSMRSMGSHLPAAQLDRFVPTMLRINRVLEKQCGLRVSNQTRD